jgi:hypothetical protein
MGSGKEEIGIYRKTSQVFMQSGAVPGKKPLQTFAFSGKKTCEVSARAYP